MAEKSQREWTPEQLAAIQTRQANLLVAAAAGAGKTAVLVERLIRRLTDPGAPVSLENLLVVTFTDAAAAEMRQRIGAALEEAVARRPENEAWRRQLLLLNRAAISTIHAFCLRTLRTYFYRLDLDPAFRVMDPAEADLMQLEVLDRVLEEAFAAEPDGGPITDLADGLGGRGDAALVDLVLKVWGFTRSLPWPEKWLEDVAAAYDVPAGTPLAELPWYRELQQAIALVLEEAAFYLGQARALAAGPGGPAVYLDYLEREEREVRELRTAVNDLSWEEFWQRLAGIDFARLPAVRRESVDPELKERAAGYRDQAKKLLRSLQQEGDRDEDAIRDELARAGTTVQALVGLVRRFAAAYSKEKRRRSLLDFSDLEHLCLQVLLNPAARPGELRPSEVALELRRRYEEVLVDEYQDINSIQDAILTLVSRQGAAAPNLFMVGDVKQSIYRFRLANPELFLAKYRTYPAYKGEPSVVASRTSRFPHPFLGEGWTDGGERPAGEEGSARPVAGPLDQEGRCNGGTAGTPGVAASPGSQGPCRRILLKANFRSRQGVVDGVNFIFRQVFSRQVGELEYNVDAALVGRAAYPENPAAVTPAVEVYLLERKVEDDVTALDVGEDLPSPSSTVGAGATGHPGATLPDRWDTALLAGGQGNEPASNEIRYGGVTPATSSGTLDVEDLTALEREALLVARRIREMVWGTQEHPGPEFQVWDTEKKAYRDVTWRDIVILLRATKDRAPVFLEALQQHGIPAYADLGGGYFAATEVETILSLLRVIDNPRQDIPLAAVLRSPLVGLTAEELARVRLAAPGEDFYTAVVKTAGTANCSASGASGKDMAPDLAEYGGPDVAGALVFEGDSNSPGTSLSARLASFLARLERWRTMARRQPLGDVIWQLYRETGYLEFAGGLPGGAQRQANLRALLDRARQFEGFTRHGLFRFLRFIERLQQNEGDLGTARALGENEDVVRVMSIHKAKGLEFPVVIVADLGHAFNLRDLSGDVLLHGHLGLAPLYFDTAAGVKYPTLAYLATAHRLRLEALSEEARILYVALTRAREKLLLVGSARDLPRRAASWCAGLVHHEEHLPAMLMARAGSHLDWVAAALARHPHGAPVRELAGVEGGCILADPSCWRVEVVRGPEVETGLPGTAVGLAPSCQQLDRVVEVAEGDTRPVNPLGGEQGLTGGKEQEAQIPIAAGTAAPVAPPAIPDVNENEPSCCRAVPGPSPAGVREVPQPARDIPRLQQEVDRRLAWVYPHQPLTALPVKLAVTELKRRFDVFNENDAPVRPGSEASAGRLLQTSAFTRRPLFLQEQKGLTAAEKGTATHLVLQHVDLSRPVTGASLAGLLQLLVEEEVLTPEQAQAVDLGAIGAFFAGPLGRRLLDRPDRVRRELPFSLALPVAELYPHLPAAITTGEITIVQGIIDCLVEEEGGFLLLDFKTGRVPPDPRAAYGDQLWFYSRAVETIFNRPVKEALLYFLDGGKDYRVCMTSKSKGRKFRPRASVL
ncbi:UvrD-helicase domain-containing protein [Moorella naiadis (nom. illeg.)]|uniref:UvrD-helicase domain-containing protein n=1 Tax=Moorella naiadis (nom. illeg.) TaxID=3093670 RepID=UPI003D9C95F2